MTGPAAAMTATSWSNFAVAFASLTALCLAGSAQADEASWNLAARSSPRPAAGANATLLAARASTLAGASSWGTGPACYDWEGCDGLPGDCCPATDGTMLACCGSADPPAVPPTASPVAGAPPPPLQGYRNIYAGNNPLGIQALSPRSNNYFLIIGDWGRSGGPGACQANVAARMKDYVQGQKNAGKNLLFIASVGDNFYWSGVTPAAWDQQWGSVYGTNDAGSPLHNVPWMSVMGNHDYGNNDPYAACPMARPISHVQGQPYGCKQFNSDKNPSRPASAAKYWLPDYNYHYTIPEADLEVIALDTNAHFMGSLGGDPQGSQAAMDLCGGRNAVSAFLQDVAQAGSRLLIERAQQGTAKTVLIIQHYPGACGKDLFVSNLPASRQGQVEVICAYGHVHEQACDGNSATGQCNMILAGGGGGCCEPVITQAGFTAVGLTDGGGFNTEMVNLPPGCQWRRRLQVQQQDGARIGQNTSRYV